MTDVRTPEAVTEVRLILNGRETRAQCPDRTHLGDFVRDTHRLTGTHLGCEHGVCGACTLLVNDRPVRSCITFAAACQDARITTIEGYGDDPLMHQLRISFSRHHALQCGYCTPGMLATARDIVLRHPDADEALVRHELAGNLCRCTGYVGIVQAILAVLAENKASERADTDQRSHREAFASFDVLPSALPARVVAERSGVERGAAADDDGWTRIQSGFEIPYPLKDVWTFMTDLPALASCLPGATLTETTRDKVKGQVAIKFGPITARMNGAARIERNEAERRVTMRGAGQDSLSGSRATGRFQYQITEREPALTDVAVDLQFSLQGPLAQFSRSGLVRDFVRRMIVEVGANIVRKMNPAASVDQRATSARLNPIAIFFSVLWQRVKRLLRTTDSGADR